MSVCRSVGRCRSVGAQNPIFNSRVYAIPKRVRTTINNIIISARRATASTTYRTYVRQTHTHMHTRNFQPYYCSKRLLAATSRVLSAYVRLYTICASVCVRVCVCAPATTTFANNCARGSQRLLVRYCVRVCVCVHDTLYRCVCVCVAGKSRHSKHTHTIHTEMNALQLMRRSIVYCVCACAQRTEPSTTATTTSSKGGSGENQACDARW